MIDVKCIITRKVYDSGEGYRVYSCRPVEAENTDNLELNKYGDFTISINQASFSIGNTIHVCVEKDGLSKYPGSYKFVSYYNQLGADISPETAKQIMCNFMTESQAISIIDAYPDFIRLILDDKTDEIDTKKIYGVGKHRLALYQRKIKEHCKEIAYAPICYKWNIKDIRLVSGRFGSPQEFESAVNSAPYATLIDKCECSFVEADKTILKNNRELRSSEERCLYACLHELKQNEWNGSTIMSTAELSHIIFDKYNACYDKLVDVVKRSSKIHYDDVCKSVARESTYQSELAIAQILLEKIKKTSKLYIELDKYREIDGITLTDEQLSAVDMVANNSVCMLNGYSGSGKSTSTKAIIRMLEDCNKTYTLLAPTGISSRVLSKATGRKAQTIHMFLATNNDAGDYVLLDEASMCAVDLIAALLQSPQLNKDTNLIFVCDNAQLLSISCGNFVQDVIDSGLMPRVSLSKIFRYKTSGIITEVTDVRNGEHGNLTNDYADYSFVQIADEPMKQISAAYDKFLSMGYTKDDILILCPYNKSKIGSTAINTYMQDKYNHNEETGFRAQKNGIRMHDRVINKKNNYHVIACSWSDDEQEYVDSGQMFVANGDIGEVVQYKNNDNEQYLIIRFGDRCAKFEPSDILNLQLAYCISCHSSQGCQAKAVICIFDRMHQSLVTRNLLYVAMSRAQEQLCVIGDYDTIVCGVSKQENLERKTFLKNMLTNPKKYDIILST